MRPGPKPKNINMNAIRKLTSPEVAYVLGFLWADGHILTTKTGSVRVSIEALDSDMQEVSPLFTKLGKWATYTRLRPHRTKPVTSLSCCSRLFYEWLRDKGYDTKSEGSASLILQSLPAKLKSYWLRGFFDGDGNLYLLKNTNNAQITFAGSHYQDWSGIAELISDLGCTFTIRRDSRPYSTGSTLRLTGRANTFRLLAYIYSGKVLGFSRKRKTYLKYKDQQARGLNENN